MSNAPDIFDPDSGPENGVQYTEKYGLLFPASLPDAMIELMCWKKWREDEYKTGSLKDPWECFWRGIYQMLPREDFIRHTWSEEHVFDWTTENFVITWGCASSGKAQPLDAIVYTPDGPRTMADMSVGDRVCSHDGLTAEVIATHDVGLQDEYRVTFNDGTSTLCAGSHLWEVGRRSSGWGRHHIVTTEWLKEWVRPGRYYIPTCEPVYFGKRNVPIPPYLLGALLGDGCFGGASGDGSLRLSAADVDIVEAFAALLDKDYQLKEVSPGDYLLVKKAARGGRTPNYYIRAAKEHKLWGKLAHEKFIPEDYLFNSVECRRELLAGLLDTDGTCCKLGSVSFSTSSPRLAKDVQALVQSLGGLASISAGKTGYKTKTGEYKECRTSYHVSVRVPDRAGLFKSSRKQRRVRTTVRTGARRFISSVELTGRKVPMKCITVNHPRGLYLTNDFIATHNSNDYGLLAMMDWWVDPTKTVTILASTTLGMLKIRSFESVNRYFNRIKKTSPFRMPGKLSKTTTAVLLDDTEDGVDTTEKASVRGVAVAEGSENEARAKLQGAHLDYVRLLLDELSQMRSAAMKVRTNLAIGAKDFKLIGLCNPDSFTDLAARHSVPVHPAGFKSLDPETAFEWRSQYGKVRRHDGMRSPAILQPERAKELSFLLTPSVLEELVKQAGGNMDDAQIWTMVRGWPPAQGKTSTLLSMEEVVKYEAMGRVVWRSGPAIRLLGVDPALSEGGNRGVMQGLEIGFDVAGRLILHFTVPRDIKIDASSNVPKLDQVSGQVVSYAAAFLLQGQFIDVNVRSALLSSLGPFIGVDDAATQSLADWLISRYGISPRRFAANAAASDLKLAETDVLAAKDRYYNQGTEMWAAIASFVRSGQVRGLPVRAADQLTSRPIDPGKRPIRLVSKKASVADGGTGSNSPDDMDAVGFAGGVARFFLNLIAGKHSLPKRYAEGDQFSRSGSAGTFLKQARKYDIDAEAYAHGM